MTKRKDFEVQIAFVDNSERIGRKMVAIPETVLVDSKTIHMLHSTQLYDSQSDRSRDPASKHIIIDIGQRCFTARSRHFAQHNRNET